STLQDLPSFPPRRSSDLCSEAEAHAELRRARLAVAATECREHEEVRQPQVGGRVAEVCDVENVVQLDARVELYNIFNVANFSNRSEEHTSELQSRFDLVC